MLEDLPEELRGEVRSIGRIRVYRHMRWAAYLLDHDIEPRQIIEKLLSHGFSLALAEWIVYGLRAYSGGEDPADGPIEDFKEPSLFETLARAIFSVVLVVFFVVLGNLLTVINSPLSYLCLMADFLGGVLALIYTLYALTDLGERLRRR